MKSKLLIVILFLLQTNLQMNGQQPQRGHYAMVNGLNLYYEINGKGMPLVLLHGGGSTIESTYGRILPVLAKEYMLIAVELQAHGHTLDIDRALSFEQDADDVAALLKYLHIQKANFMGFSNGGTTCIQIAIRYPTLVNKLVLASAIYSRTGIPPEFWTNMEHASLESMPHQLKEAYLKENPDSSGLIKMFNRDVARMKAFKDINDSDIANIKSPTLVINGDKDIVTTEHALLLSRTLANASLAIIPGGHGEYIGEICSANEHSQIPAFTATMIAEFLNK
jgi:pimeloyl-ACP methyl ester carboxylesterase